MNILQRKMFAEGDAVVNPSFEQNPIGSEYAGGYEGSGYQPYELIQNIEKEGDGYVATQRAPDGTLVKKTPINLALSATGDPAEAYRRQIKNEGLRATKEAGYGIAGLFSGRALGSAAMRQFGPRITQALTSKNIFNPLTSKRSNIMGPTDPSKLSSFDFGLKTGPKYGLFGGASLYGLTEGQTTEAEVQKEIDKAEAAAASNNFDPIQNALDKEKKDALAKKNAEKSAAAKQKEKDKKELNYLNNVLEGFELKGKTEKEAFIQERKDKKERNTGIFLNEISKAMAGTDNLADGLAIGAANSSDAIMKADEAEELSFAEFLKEQKEEKAAGALKETDKLAISKEYNKAYGEIEGNQILLNELSTLRTLLTSNNVAGLKGWMSRLVTRAQGFTATDLELNDASKAANIGKFLEARMVQALLDEKGKTISDADRALIKDLLGNITNATSNRAEIIDLLRLTEATVAKTTNDARNIVDLYDAEYIKTGKFPNLEILQRNINKNQGRQEEQEVTVTADDIIG
jgi:hypothetical protein